MATLSPDILNLIAVSFVSLVITITAIMLVMILVRQFWWFRAPE